MSHENSHQNLGHQNLGHQNLGNGNQQDTISISQSSPVAPMGLVYSAPQQQQSHQQPPIHQHIIQQPPIHQHFNYQQTTYEVPRYQFPKIRYDYGWPDYNQTVYDRSVLYYQNPYKLKDDDRISQFFIGSVTVVGLFILFRILEKNK